MNIVVINERYDAIIAVLIEISDTRWASRYMNIVVINELYDAIIAVLIEVSKLRGHLETEIRTIAVGILNDVRYWNISNYSR